MVLNSNLFIYIIINKLVYKEPPNSIYFGLKHQFDQLWINEPKLNLGCHC